MDFSEQYIYAPVKIDGKWGIVNFEFQEVLEPEFDWIDEVYDVYGLAVGVREGVACIIYLEDIETYAQATYLPLDGYMDIELFYMGLIAEVQSGDGLKGIVSVYGDIVVEAKYADIYEIWQCSDGFNIFYVMVKTTDGDYIIVYLNLSGGVAEEIWVEDDTIAELSDLMQQSQ